MLNKLWNAKGAIALALMAIVLPACAQEAIEAEVPASPIAAAPQTTTPVSPAGNVTTEEVTDKTNALIGKTVTIRSEPVKKVGPNTFTVGDEEFFGTETILVVNASGRPVLLPKDDDVEMQVTGEVSKFVLADINKRYGLNLEPNLYVEYEDKPAIIAQSIAPAPEPGEITKNPSQYYGRTLAVTGEIEKIYGSNTFTLDEEKLFGATDLLVLVANPTISKTPIKEDETVAVTGVLRPFVIADLEREYDFSWDAGIQKELEAEYKTKPVLVVQSVYQSAIPQED